jgi:type I restriction enzyme S subunit
MSAPNWPDAVPPSWAVAPLYARYEVQLGKMLDTARFTGTSARPYLRNIDVQWDSINVTDLPVMDFESRDRLKFSLRPGDLLVCEGGDIGRTAIWRGELEECYFQKAIHRLRPLCSAECPRYLYYALRAAADYGLFAADSNPNTIPHLTAEKLRRHRFPFPPANEQRAIADFLDRETAKVDDLIARKQQLLILLQSQQDALVRQFVVGQDLDVPKRRSRYSWLGDVPAHWKVLALKRISKRVVVGIAEASTHAYADSGVPLVRTTNVKANKIDTSDLLYINKEFADKNRSKYMRAGDIVTARTGNPGISGVIPTELDGSQCFTMLITTLREDHVPEFFCYYINSDPARTYFALEGWGTAQINISVPILQMLPTPCPPEKEQRQIAERIKRSMEASERQFNLINEAIERLREHRSSLISAAVTGQIDVRTYRPQEAAALCQ